MTTYNKISEYSKMSNTTFLLDFQKVKEKASFFVQINSYKNVYEVENKTASIQLDFESGDIAFYNNYELKTSLNFEMQKDKNTVQLFFDRIKGEIKVHLNDLEIGQFQHESFKTEIVEILQNFNT